MEPVKGVLGNYLLKKFFDNLEREVKAKKVRFSYFGHYHLPYTNSYFSIVGSYRKNCRVETNRFLILADVHIGRYHYSYAELEKLIKLIKNTRKKVILLGDFFDFWYLKAKKIEELFGDLVDLVERENGKGKLIYVAGNHDFNISKYFDVDSTLFYFDKKGNILFTHGHLQDPLFSKIPLSFYSFLCKNVWDKFNSFSKIGHFINSKFLKME